jgi:hypothetical protein
LKKNFDKSPVFRLLFLVEKLQEAIEKPLRRILHILVGHNVSITAANVGAIKGDMNEWNGGMWPKRGLPFLA